MQANINEIKSNRMFAKLSKTLNKMYANYLLGAYQ
jgi:hypothetical protein